MSNLLKNIVAYTKYAKFLFDEGRKETWNETLERCKAMFRERVKELNPKAASYFNDAINAIDGERLLPSMRAMQFAGEAIRRNPQRIYNCMYKSIETARDISEIFYMLLCGCGVGYSVRNKHINKLPAIVPIKSQSKFVIEDTIEGWANAAYALLHAYLGSGIKPMFYYNKIRQAGSILKTTGGVAPGAEPLREAFNKIDELLSRKAPGSKLTSVDVSDIVCILAHCVLSGGNRRSALIGLFDFDDVGMYTSKHGEWFKEHPYRSRANISAMPSYDVGYEAFEEYMKGALDRGWGEPGYVFTNDESMEYGVNPCSEIGLRDGGACNLCEINLSAMLGKEEFYKTCERAAILGTIQATFTDFSYVSSIWSKTCREDALLGVGLTGIQTSMFLHKNAKKFAKILRHGAYIIRSINREASYLLGINPARRLTTIKPAGSTSCIFGCSSGVHPPYAEYYIRRVRISKQAAAYSLIKETAPSLMEDAIDNPKFDGVLSIPVKMSAPAGNYTKNTTAFEQLDAAKFFYENWILPGHVEGKDTHNVSLTIHFKPEEVNELCKKLYEYRNSLRCVSVFPYSDFKYAQAPFEEITEEEYNNLISEASKLDSVFAGVKEGFYTPTDIGGACDGGLCEMNNL